MAEFSSTKFDQDTLAQLIQVGPLINSSLELEEILKEVMQLTDRLLKCEASSLLLLDDQTNCLIFQTATGQKAKDLRNVSLKMGQGIAGLVAQNGKPIIVSDAASDERHFSQADWKTGFSTKSIVCVPLKTRGKIIGVVEAINKKDYLKFDEDDLALLSIIADHAAIAIQNAKVFQELRDDHEVLKQEIGSRYTLVGHSPKMKDILNIAQKVAPSESTLLIRGKSGTGKEMLARTIHNLSPRSKKPFISVTCSILSQTLLESELFGHEKGAFTGADARKIGRFERANGGTLFLDEIGTLAQETQLRLLRVLQDKEFERVGGNETIHVNVRIIAATNENLENAISDSRFREDLYYRLKVIEIFMPELRERPEDIALLADHFLKIFSKEMGRPIQGISPEALKILKEYHWPGNVRELRNVIERSVVLGSSDRVLPEDLSMELREKRLLPSTSHSQTASTATRLEEAEAEHIREILNKTLWNKSKAAQLLGISRNRLDRKIAAFGLKEDS